MKPGDAFFARTDVRFSHEYVTPMAEALFRRRPRQRREGHRAGERLRVSRSPDVPKQSNVAKTSRDGSAGKGRRAGYCAGKLHQKARHEALWRDDPRRAAREAICHNKVIEELALPGQVVIGTDSHTCMAGALGCFAFGVGSTDMANAWFTSDVRIRVPETVRYVSEREDAPRRLREGRDAAHPSPADYMKTSKGIGKVLEFTGDDLKNWPLDERATLTNMAVEAGGFTGIIEADEFTLAYIVKMRGSTRRSAEGFVRQRSRRRVRGHVRDRSRDDRADGRDARRSAQRHPAR